MVIEPLTRAHDRSAFDCGIEEMNRYLSQYARQNDEKGLSRTFVAVSATGAARIHGYYTLSNGSVAFENLPDEQRLPRYPVPTALLGRLAVDRDSQGQGLGTRLLLDALRRSAQVSQEIGIFAVEVVALDEGARAFYTKFGFRPLADDRLHLYMTLKAIHKLNL